MVAGQVVGRFSKNFHLLIGGTALFILYFMYNSDDNNYSTELEEQIEIRNYQNSDEFRELLARTDSILASKHVHCQNSSNHLKNCITIVTAFFSFSKSKHSLSEYEEWMFNFLSRVDTPMVIFTQPTFVNNMSRLREGKPTHFIVYEEIWNLPWIKKRYLKNIYQKMHDKDPEAGYHSPDLYAIWNSKLWMLNRVSQEENVFNSTFFFWMDIGSVRESNHTLKNFPDVQKVIKVFGENEKAKNYKKFNVFAVAPFRGFKQFPESNTYEDFAMGQIFVMGGFFGGTIFGVHWFAQTFYSIHDQFLRRGYFVGKDQNIYNFMSTQYPDDILVVCGCQKNKGCVMKGSKWFYFQKWYANNEENNQGISWCSPLKYMTQFLLEMKQ